MDIVVARYNTDEFYKLTDMFINSNVIVYNKGCDMDKPCIRLHNTGRESHTYLYHIVNNYNNLNDYTVFIQDDTENHIPDYNKFVSDMKNSNSFFIYPCTWRKDYPGVHSRSVVDGIVKMNSFVPHDAVKCFFERNNISYPKRYTTNTCAFMGIPRENIYKRSQDFYRQLLDETITDQTGHIGYVLEHAWHVIFS